MPPSLSTSLLFFSADFSVTLMQGLQGALDQAHPKELQSNKRNCRAQNKVQLHVLLRGHASGSAPLESEVKLYNKKAILWAVLKSVTKKEGSSLHEYCKISV